MGGRNFVSLTHASGGKVAGGMARFPEIIAPYEGFEVYRGGSVISLAPSFQSSLTLLILIYI
ncbi:MAG: hypothetical protein AB2748_22950 [Candidatus Thiodiazotropha endolucinida]